jgi:hypothetical protein
MNIYGRQLRTCNRSFASVDRPNVELCIRLPSSAACLRLLRFKVAVAVEQSEAVSSTLKTNCWYWCCCLLLLLLLTAACFDVTAGCRIASFLIELFLDNGKPPTFNHDLFLLFRYSRPTSLSLYCASSS